MESKAIAEVFFESKETEKPFLYLEDAVFTYAQIRKLCYKTISYILSKNLINKEFYILTSEPQALIVLYLSLNYLNKDVHIISENVKNLLFENNSSENNIFIDDKAGTQTLTYSEFVNHDLLDIQKVNDYITSIKERHSALVQFTSGTTGTPSKVIRTKESCYIESLDLVKMWHYDENSKVACFTPFSYSFAFGNVVMASIIASASIISCKSFNIKVVQSLLTKYSATHFVTVVSIVKLLLLQNETQSFPSIKHIICSGSKLNKKDERKFYKKFKIHIGEQYGMTETGSLLYSYICNDYFEHSFPSVQYRVENDIFFVERKFTNLGEINTHDFVKIDKKQRIRILGRADSTLKLDDKRYSVEYIEQLFNNQDYLTIAKKLLSNKKIVLSANKENFESVQSVVKKLKGLDPSIKVKIMKVK